MLIVARQEVPQHPVGLLNGRRAREAHLGDQTVLEGVPRTFHPTLRLRRMGQDEFDAQLRKCSGELCGLAPASKLFVPALSLEG